MSDETIVLEKPVVKMARVTLAPLVLLGITMFSYGLLYLLPKLFVRFKVVGKENMQKDGHVLYLIRHRNYAGTFAVQGTMMYHWLFGRMQMYPYNVAKLGHIENLGSWAPWLAEVFRIYPLPLNDREKRKRIYNEEVRLLTGRKSVSLTLFPAGRRDTFGQQTVSEFQPAIGKLLKETKCKVVFVHDDDSQVFPSMKVNSLLQAIWKTLTFRRPLVKVTISKALDMSQAEDSNLGRLCNDPDSNSADIAMAAHDLYAVWSSSIDDKVIIPEELRKSKQTLEDLSRIA